MAEAAPAVDVPPNVAAALQLESLGSIQQTARDSRNSASLASSALQAGIASTQNLLGTSVTSRAVSGVVATPIAGPTNAQEVAK